MTERPQDGHATWDSKRDGDVLLLLAAITLALQLLVFDCWISLLDEGAIAQMGEQILQGKLPYREGVHLAFPGIFFLTAGLYAVFEPSLLVGRYFMVAAFTVYVALFYLLMRGFACRSVAFLATLIAISYRMWVFPHWQMLSYTPIAILCLLGGVAILYEEVGKPSLLLRTLAGLTIGVGILFKQDSTSITLAALCLFVLVHGWHRARSFPAGLRESVLFGLAGSTPVLLMLLAFLPSGLSGEILYQTVWVPLVAKPLWASTSGGGAYTGFPPLLPLFEPSPTIRTGGFFTYLPGLLLDLHWRDILEHPLYRETVLPEVFIRLVYCLPYALLGGFLLREGVLARAHRGAATSTTLRLRLVLVLAIAMLLSFNRPRDWLHLMVLYTPTLLLLGAALELLYRRQRGIALALGGGVALLALGVAFELAFAARAFYHEPLSSPRAGLLVSPHMSRVLEPLLQALAPEEGDDDPAPLAALPASPTLNFLTGRPLATRFITLLPLEEFPDRDEQILRDFARDARTDYVYSLQRAAISPRPQEYAPGVFADLVRRFRLGAGPQEVFSGTRTEGVLLALLVPREPAHERLLVDLARLAPLPEEGRDQADPTVDVWPFETDVVTPDLPRPPAESSLRYRVTLEEPARLRFAVAMNPDEWANFIPCALHFSVLVDGHTRFERTLDSRRDFGDRRWVDVDLPVAAGPHEIELRSRAENVFGAGPGIAGWARPRLVAAEERPPASNGDHELP